MLSPYQIPVFIACPDVGLGGSVGAEADPNLRHYPTAPPIVQDFLFRPIHGCRVTQLQGEDFRDDGTLGQFASSVDQEDT